ncbi:hypothetical protein EDC01DRAFT_635932 [Geopyxis carbonaria]|nr:hypothetical protein EDC01DRAFT_635932 [Geopyxis carbonaria]
MEFETIASTVPKSDPQSDPQYSHDSSNASTPSDGLKKRKYEEATRDEKWELYQHHSSNPHLKQRELAEWFSERFNKQINQSTVSRNLKKFKVAPPTQPGTLPEIAPRKRERKHSCSSSPTQQNIENSPQLKHHTSAVSLPPTPPPRDSRQSPIDAKLWSFYSSYCQHHPRISESELTKELKAEAQKLFASIRPPPPPEKIDQEVVDDEWITTWKRNHGISPSSPSFINAASPRGSTVRQPMIGNSKGEIRTSSEETEPRSPVSAVSSNDNHGEDYTPMKALLAATESHSHLQRGVGGVAAEAQASAYESPEKRRKKDIKRLRRDIEKRDQRIQKETLRKNDALRRLEELERLEKFDGLHSGSQASGEAV